MRARILQPQSNNWMRYGGILLLGLVFLVFLGILLVSSISTSFLGKCVAVMDIKNEITTHSESSLFYESNPGSEEIANTIEKLNKRDDVGAVVFVIDSPGGSVVASREIYNAVKALNKPKVSYFREVAASGAYYIAAGTDYIISDPDALTGSIGVVMIMSDMSGLFSKLGVNFTTIKSGELKDIGTINRPMTDKERIIFQALVDEIFQEFKSIVVENRGSKLNRAKFEEILDARILSGRQAKEIGLVDALGTKKDAIEKAAQLANITDAEPHICEIMVSSNSGRLFDSRTLIKGLVNAIFNTNVDIGVKKVGVRYE